MEIPKMDLKECLFGCHEVVWKWQSTCPIDRRGYILGEWVGINLVGGWVFSFLFLIFPFLIFLFQTEAGRHRDCAADVPALIYRILASYKPSLTAYICGGGGGGREDRNG